MKNHDIQIIKVGAEWCSDCKRLDWDNYVDIDKLDKDRLDHYQSIMDEYHCEKLPVMIIYDNKANKVVDVTDKLETPSEVIYWSTKRIMSYLADEYGYKKSEHFDKIVDARVRMKLGWDKCPCGGDNRGCISDLCKQEIENDGHCHCNCFLK